MGIAKPPLRESPLTVLRTGLPPRRVARPRLYLYLDKAEFADTWIHGGPVPFRPASVHLNDERGGTKTPDENLIHRSNRDITKLAPFLNVQRGVTNFRGLAVVGCSAGGLPIPDTYGDFYVEDGLVLCMSVANGASIAAGLEKTVCVEILDVDELKRLLDQQLGTEGRIGACGYTDDHRRDHFLGSSRNRVGDF